MTLALIALAAALYFAWAFVRAASAFDQAFNIEYTEENMNAIDKLKSVLCNHEGGVCIAGKDADREIIAESLGELERMMERLAELEKQEPVAIVKHAVGGPVVHLVGNVKPQTLLYAAPAASPDVAKLFAKLDKPEGRATLAEAQRAELLTENQSLKAELEAARKDAEWQPIETAPKDGSSLLLAKLGYEATTGCFHPDFKLWTTIGVYEFEEPHEWKEWFENNEYHPTHWKPLPAPPAIEQKGGA